MSIKQIGLVAAAWLVVAACAIPADEPATAVSTAAVTNPDDPGGGDPGGGGSGGRSCAADIDCNFACTCQQGFCHPDGFGPGLPQSHCDETPTRLCWADSVCAAGCICGSNSHCQPDGFGPANPDCHLPP